MTTITWLGEDGGSDTNTWNGVVFKRGEAVDLDKIDKALKIDKDHMIHKAKNNRFYRVSGEPNQHPTGEQHHRQPDQPRQFQK